jgi:hypothetical protein
MVSYGCIRKCQYGGGLFWGISFVLGQITGFLIMEF